MKEKRKNIPFKKSSNEKWNSLSGKQKARYVWDYYKFPIAVCLICLYIVGYTVYGHFTKKEVLLYTALVNVSAGEQLTNELDGGFLDFLGADVSKTELELYTGIGLTDDPDAPNHEYAYASRVKIIASIDDEKLDVVLMNREAFDTFAQNGYLYNMEELLQDTDLQNAAEWEPYLVSGTVILEDNADELLQDSSLEYQAVTEEYPMGLNVSQADIFRQAGFEEDVYLGVIKNSPRMDMAAEYIRYLFGRNRHFIFVTDSLILNNSFLENAIFTPDHTSQHPDSPSHPQRTKSPPLPVRYTWLPRAPVPRHLQRPPR